MNGRPLSDGELTITAIVVVIVMVLVGACERAKWRECRRHHPTWYCVDEVMQRGSR